MDESIRITKAQLQQALLRWEQAFRNGETQTIEAAAAKPAEQVAAESAEHLWKDLQAA